MKSVRKVKVQLSQSQQEKTEKLLGGLRFLWNQYLATRNKIYLEHKITVTAYQFDMYTNLFLSEKYPWIKDISSKARKDCFLTLEKAFKRFFKGTSNYPQFKSKKRDPVKSFFFIKNGISISPDKIKIPILGEVKLLEKGYLTPDLQVTSGRVIKETDGYYIMLIVDDCPKDMTQKRSNPLGIDVGIKTYATISNGERCLKVPNPNKTNRNIKKAERKIIALQRVISGKVEKNKRKGGTATDIYQSKNIQKLWVRVRKYMTQLRNIRRDFIKKLCHMLVVKAKPRYITIEDLGTQDMLEKAGHKLADRLQKCNLYYFRTHLTWKCKQYGIELRIADRMFASSKTCSGCGHKKHKLKLGTRTYVCKHCGLTIDRDENAAINLLRTEKYTPAY